MPAPNYSQEELKQFINEIEENVKPHPESEKQKKEFSNLVETLSTLSNLASKEKIVQHKKANKEGLSAVAKQRKALLEKSNSIIFVIKCMLTNECQIFSKDFLVALNDTLEPIRKIIDASNQLISEKTAPEQLLELSMKIEEATQAHIEGMNRLTNEVAKDYLVEIGKIEAAAKQEDRNLIMKAIASVALVVSSLLPLSWSLLLLSSTATGLFLASRQKVSVKDDSNNVQAVRELASRLQKENFSDRSAFGRFYEISKKLSDSSKQLIEKKEIQTTPINTKK